MTDTTLRPAAAPNSKPAVKPTRKAVRPDIQGLRALAVVVVVLDHLTGWPAGGFVGVDIFFVISGFLITGLLLREYDRTDRISFSNFYRRRIRRIMPVATVVLAVTVLAARAVLPADRAAAVQGDAGWAFIFGANWHLAAVGTDYFQKGLPPSPLQHFWSLSVEEQFYLIWPWVMLALVLLAARIGWSKVARRRVILGFFVVATAASFAWSMHQTGTALANAYFNTFGRAWELGVGAILAAISPLLGRLPAWTRNVGTALGLAGMAISVFVVPEGQGFPAPWAALPVLSAAAVIAMGTSAPERSAAGMTLRENLLRPLTNRVATYLGDISYSLYLWHFPLVVLLLAFFEKGTVAYIGTALLAMTALSVLSYHLLEVPVRNSRWLERKEISTGLPPIGFVKIEGQYVPVVETTTKTRQERPSRRLVAALAVCSLIALGGLAAGYSAVQQTQAAAQTTTPLVATTRHVAGQCVGADFMPAAEQKCDNQPSATLNPTVARFAKDTGPEYVNCWREEKDKQKICHYGSTAKDAVRVAVVGDSHGGSLAPAIDDPATLKKLNWSVDLITGYGCQWKTEHQLTGCGPAMDDTMKRFENQPYDVIITSAARWALKDEDIQYSAEEYKDAWRAVTQRGTQVLVVADNPLISDEAIACFNRVGFEANSTRCGDPRDKALAQEDPLVVAARAPYQPKVHLIDMTDFYCADDFCPSVIGGTVVYRDSVGHVTASYMRTVRPYLFEKFENALPK